MLSNIKTAAEIGAQELAVAKENAIKQINAERDAAIAAGVTYDGHTYQSNNQSIADLTASAALTLMDNTIVIPWLTVENVTVQLSASDVQALAATFAGHKTNLVLQARAKKDSVLAATTVAEVETALSS